MKQLTGRRLVDRKIVECRVTGKSRRWIKRHLKIGRMPGGLRVVPEIVHYPGDVLILDWEKLRTVGEGARVRVLWVVGRHARILTPECSI